MLYFKQDKFSIKSQQWNKLFDFMLHLPFIFRKDLPQQILTENERCKNLYRLPVAGVLGGADTCN